jgi:hypothetical protein
MTFEFKIKNTVVFSIVSESNLIFPNFYSLEAPVWHALIDGNWFFLGNIFIMHFQWNEQVDYNTAGRGLNQTFRCNGSMEVFLVASTRFNLNLEIFAKTWPNRQQH